MILLTHFKFTLLIIKQKNTYLQVTKLLLVCYNTLIRSRKDIQWFDGYRAGSEIYS